VWVLEGLPNLCTQKRTGRELDSYRFEEFAKAFSSAIPLPVGRARPELALVVETNSAGCPDLRRR